MQMKRPGTRPDHEGEEAASITLPRSRMSLCLFSNCGRAGGSCNSSRELIRYANTQQVRTLAQCWRKRCVPSLGAIGWLLRRLIISGVRQRELEATRKKLCSIHFLKEWPPNEDLQLSLFFPLRVIFSHFSSLVKQVSLYIYPVHARPDTNINNLETNYKLARRTQPVQRCLELVRWCCSCCWCLLSLPLMMLILMIFLLFLKCYRWCCCWCRHVF